MTFILNGADHQNVSPTWRFTHPTHGKPVGEHSWDLDFLFFCSSKNKEILPKSPVGFTIEQKGLKIYKMIIIVIGALFDLFFFLVSCGLFPCYKMHHSSPSKLCPNYVWVVT